MRLRLLLPLAVLAALFVGVTACEKTEPTPQEEKEIREALDAYLKALADAYASGDPHKLDGFATLPEIDATAKLLRTLSFSGDRLEATLLGYKVQSLSVFRVVNAYVRLEERWHVKRVDAKTGRVKGENPNVAQHSSITMRKIKGKWMVVSRMVDETVTPKWASEEQ